MAGGSDIALCCDFIVMDEDARIGYPPARVWGCLTTAMWVYRVGAERAKRMLLTGDLIDGRTALAWGVATNAVLLAELDNAVAQLADRMSGLPRNQLMMQKLMINQAYESMGLHQTRMLATLFDGITRHSPEGVWFKKLPRAKAFAARCAGAIFRKAKLKETRSRVCATRAEIKAGRGLQTGAKELHGPSQMIHAMSPQVFSRVAERKNGVI